MCDYFAREKVDNYANIKIVLSQFKTSNIADPSLIRLLSIELLPQNVLLSFWLTQFQIFLKEEGGDGHTYSPEQQKLMVWYTYFFLNRGKPSTHIAALSQLSDEELKENVPPVLQRLIETADHILKGDKNENCAS